MKLKVMSLNIMHARCSGRTSIPLAYRHTTIAKNTRAIAERIKHADPDIVGLQEVDGPSLLNGHFDQLGEIQRLSGYSHAYFAPHSRIRGPRRDLHVAGTAILSKHPLKNARTAPFSRSFPIPRKGYAVADIELPDGRHVTFVSAHLLVFNVGKSSKRVHQSMAIVEELSDTPHPILLTGDMNCSHADEPTIPTLIDGLDLHAYDLDAKGHETFPSWRPKRRIDWILPSKHFRFEGYAVTKNMASDHGGVLAHVVLE